MINRLFAYIKETRQELKKVNWPTRRQAVESTLLVIGISLLGAAFLGLFDYLYQLILAQILS